MQGHVSASGDLVKKRHKIARKRSERRVGEAKANEEAQFSFLNEHSEFGFNEA